MTQPAKAAAKSWSSTLRLPKSTFPPRAAAADLAKYLKQSTDDLYTWQSRERAAQAPFILHDGPPYANGDLHVGHALNKILKDIINRTELQRGRRINYIPGWDCHGLPIEQKAFEHYGWTVGNTPDAVQVRKAAAIFANDAVQKQMASFRSWAVMGAWDDHWKTMDKGFELRQLEIFRSMAKHGLIYRRNKPVYWSPSSRTALAEAELEYKEDHLSKAAFVKLMLSSPSDLGEGDPVSLLIWTTTPWTLPANQAIAINRDLEYVVVHPTVYGKLLLAKSRVQAVEVMLGQRLPIWKTAVNVDDLLQGSYHGLDPFEDTLRPIIHADFVSAEAGTGLVHNAPGHGMEDYEALKHHIRSGLVQIKAPVDDAGNFTAEASPRDPELLQGQSVFNEGNATVIAVLKQLGSLLAVHDYAHKYPYDWRTKRPVLVRATAQWFADLADIKADALHALDTVDFRPKTGQSRLRSFVENRSEWCISRQRSWGVPIPALYHKDTGDAVLSDHSVSHVIDVLSQRGTDAWWSDERDDPAWIASGLDASRYIRGTDTLDVWFDSGTSWSSIIRTHESEVGKVETWNKYADVYLEGTDQHRGWFQSSLLTSVATQKSNYPHLTPTAPFKTLLTHGFTLDGAGKKMSKSIGNVISPEQIITGEFELPLSPVDPAVTPITKGKPPRMKASLKKRGHGTGSLGPDTLRLWVASSDWSKDVVVSETVVKTVHASLHKYRVTLKLILGALADFRPTDEPLSISPYWLDRLALHQVHHTAAEVCQACENLEFHKAVTTINKWMSAELSAFYIEAIKDTLYCDSISGDRRRNAQVTLFRILEQLQAMLSPLTPMLVAESWEHYPEGLKTADVRHPFQRTWRHPDPEWRDESLSKTALPLVTAIDTACKAAQERARAEKKMGSSLESECLVHMPGVFELLSTSSRNDAIQVLERDLKEILVVSHVKVFDTGAESSLIVDRSRDFQQWVDLPYITAEDPWRVRVSKLFQPWAYFEEFTVPDGRSKGFVAVYQPVNAKCPRCWQYAVEEEESHDAHGELCTRCRGAVLPGRTLESGV